MRKYILIWYLLLSPLCFAATYTVDDDGPADFNTIQAAIDSLNNIIDANGKEAVFLYI